MDVIAGTEVNRKLRVRPCVLHLKEVSRNVTTSSCGSVQLDCTGPPSPVEVSKTVKGGGRLPW